MLNKCLLGLLVGYWKEALAGTLVTWQECWPQMTLVTSSVIRAADSHPNTTVNCVRSLDSDT